MAAKQNAFRVVVGVDFSDASVDAAHWAARWMDREWELVLAHALVMPDVDSFLVEKFPLSPSILENARIGAEGRLKELSASIGHPRTWVETRAGRPDDVILRITGEFSASLVVVGSHGEGGRARGYPGRTADSLVRSSRVPVLLANRTTPAIPKRILVALASSSVTPYVLQWTAKFAERFGARVHGVNVVGSAVLSHVLSMASVTEGKGALTQSEIDSVFSEERDEWGDQLAASGIPTDMFTTEVVFGEVSEAILAAAREGGFDMIVMGSHAGRVRRLLLGSAAAAVMRHAEVPVLVVTEPESVPAG